jgi:hypothetical protein
MSRRYVEQQGANKEVVDAMLEELRQVTEVYINYKADKGEEMKFIDVFMVAHNFHKMMVQDLAHRTDTGPKKNLYFTARDTFAKAMDELIEREG